MSGYPDRRGDTHVHREHYNAQVAIQQVVNDTQTGKTLVEIVRINLSTKEESAVTDKALSDLLTKVIDHLLISKPGKND